MATTKLGDTERRAQDRAESGVNESVDEQAYTALFASLGRLPDIEPGPEVRHQILDSFEATRAHRRRETLLMRGLGIGVGLVCAGNIGLSMPTIAGLIFDMPALILFSVAATVLVGAVSAFAARQPLKMPAAKESKT